MNYCAASASSVPRMKCTKAVFFVFRLVVCHIESTLSSFSDMQILIEIQSNLLTHKTVLIIKNIIFSCLIEIT